jgi:hypothetical protein
MQSIFAASVASSPLGVAPLGTLLLAHVKFVPMRMECLVTGDYITYICRMHSCKHGLDLWCLMV